MDTPKIVTNTITQRWSRRHFLGGAVSVAALGSFATACGSGANQSASAPTPSASDPTVFSNVPMTNKVVFITIDDGLDAV
jgi:hypothetical protein